MIKIHDRKTTWRKACGGPERAALLLAAALMLTACGSGSGESGSAAAGTVSSEVTEADNTAASEEGDGVEKPEDGNAEAGEETPEAASPGISPQEIYASVSGAVELPSMMEGDDDFIFNYYGIDPATLDGYVFASAEDATRADSVIIMRVKSADTVADMESALNVVKDQKAAEMEDYIPEQYEIVADSTVRTEGLYVYLVISENAAEIEKVIREALQ